MLEAPPAATPLEPVLVRSVWDLRTELQGSRDRGLLSTGSTGGGGGPGQLLGVKKVSFFCQAQDRVALPRGGGRAVDRRSGQAGGAAGGETDALSGRRREDGG